MKTPAPMISCLLLLSWVAIGCGGSSLNSANSTNSSSCGTLIAISVSPQNATANHSAPAPGNQQQFMANLGFPPGCPPPPVAFGLATWFVSDPVNVGISNVKDATYGTATCIGATAAPVTVTATASLNGPPVSGSASLTCN